MNQTFKHTLICMALVLSGCGGSSSSNEAPVFSQNTFELTLDEDTQGLITVNATDKNNDALTYNVMNSASNGSVTIDAQSGLVTYQPNPNFYGNDAFTIGVSDGSNSASATVNVTVNNVNDAPTFDSTTVIVSGGDIKQGQLYVTDIDGDAVSYSIVEPTSNGVLTLNETSGEITYQASDLELIDDTFTVKIDDNNGGSATEVISIEASTSSNIDRAYYYYASDSSHLKRAEAISALLTDDESQSIINSNLIRGYAEAGLVNQAELLLNSMAVVSDAQRALTMIDVADSYQAGGLTTQADELRSEANALYTQYIASKGLRAFNSDDVYFYNALADSYRYAGDYSNANQAYSILDLLFNSLAEDGYSTSILRTYFGFRDLVEDTIAQWQVSYDDDLLSLALSQAERLETYANTIPAQEVTNNRYGNEGKFTYKIRQVALFDVIEAYIELNQLEKAKSAMADLLALHGVVNYDEDYPRDIDELWEVTKVEYPYGIAGAVEMFVNLYPNDGIEPLLAGLPEDSVYLSTLPQDAEDAWLLAQVRNMDDKAAALQFILDAKDESNLRNLFTTLVAFNSSNPGASTILRNQGKYSDALTYLEQGLNILTSEEYLQQEQNVTLVLGSTGCEMLIDEVLLVAQLSQLPEATALGQHAVEQCANVALTHYADGNDASEITIDMAIRANAYLLQYAGAFDLTNIQDSLLATINDNFEKIGNDASQNFSLRPFVGWQLAKGEQFSLAQTYYNTGIKSLNQLEAEAIEDEVGELTEEFYSSSRREGDYAEYLTIIENAAGHADYPSAISNARSAWKAVVDARLEALESSNILQIAEFLPVYAVQLSRIGHYDDALALIEDDALGPVEINGILTEVATRLSIKDDFPQHQFATVDTDFDGMPNFFSPSASQEQIEASGLVLDNDSDNDGVDDGDDAYPLNPERQ